MFPLSLVKESLRILGRTKLTQRLSDPVGFPVGTVVKEPACQCRRSKRCWFHPWVKKIPWNWEWQPTPVFLPGKSHGQRSLAVCSPWGHRDTTEHAHTCNLTRQKNDTERCCIYKIFCWPTLILLVKGVWLADDLESSERGQISIAEVYNREHVWEILSTIMKEIATHRDNAITYENWNLVSDQGNSVHGIFLARILEWVAIPSSGDFPIQGLNLHLLHLLQCRRPGFDLWVKKTLWDPLEKEIATHSNIIA